MLRWVAALFLCVGFVTLALQSAPQQESFVWTGEPENLQVLPKDWPISRLRAPMIGFTTALGVKCSYCHKGEAGQPFDTYDFASDENPNKNRAREMLRMLQDIGEHLKKLEPSGAKPVNMWCHTCHRGRPRPMTLAEEMSDAYGESGVDGALARYQELRRDYYGRGAYNFESESTLNTLGYRILRADDAPGAIRIFQLNTDRFPQSANVWDSLAEACLTAGDKVLAAKYYQKSLDLNPDNQNAKDKLKELTPEKKP